MYRHTLIAVVIAAVAFAGPARPTVAADPFTLAKAVPEDVFIYTHVAHNPEHDPISERWDGVWQALADARLQDVVHDVIVELIQLDVTAGNKTEDDVAAFEAVWKRISELIDAVEWRKLASKEFIYTSRIRFPIPDYLILMRGDSDVAAANGESLRDILVTLVTWSEGKLSLTDTEVHGARLTTLAPEDDLEMPFKLELARRGDLIALCLSSGKLSESLALLAGEGDGKRLVDTARFKSAFKGLPPAENNITFFDMNRLFSGFHELTKSARAQTGENADAETVLTIVDKAIDTFSIFDYMASAESTDGSKVFTHDTLRLKPGGADTPLGKILCKQPPIKNFDHYVPKEATGFSVSNGIDLSACYGLVLDFVRENIPESEAALAAWEAVQTEIGFNLQEDLLGWISGEIVSVSLPAATPTAFSQEDWVLFVKVRDAEKARTQVNAWVDKLQGFLAEANQQLLVTDVDVKGAKGFRSVTHPLVAMLFKPIYGVQDDQLIIASSAEAIATCLTTAKGKHPSVAANERVQREGLLPKGAASSVSFTDHRQLGREIATVLTAGGVAVGLVGMFNEEPEAGVVFRGISTVLTKLKPVAEEVDFLSSSAAVTTFDGQAWHGRKVINYMLDKPTTKPADTQ